MQQERRSGHRTCLPDARVVYESASHAPREAELHDIGAGGFFVPAATPLPRGTRLAMELRLTHGGPSWSALGRVMWTRARDAAGKPSGMGVKLLDIDAAAVEAILRAIGPAAPARERTMHGVGTPTPPAVWVAKGPVVERRARSRGRAAAAMLLVAAVAAAVVGVMREQGRIPGMKGRAGTATAATAVVTTASTATPPSATASAEAAPAMPAAVLATTGVVPRAPASTSKPASRPAPWRASTPPKQSSAPPSDNPY